MDERCARIWLAEQGVVYAYGKTEVQPAGKPLGIASAIMNAYVHDGEFQLTRQKGQIMKFYYYDMRGPLAATSARGIRAFWKFRKTARKSRKRSSRDLQHLFDLCDEDGTVLDRLGPAAPRRPIETIAGVIGSSGYGRLR